jgi:hypothetical protein
VEGLRANSDGSFTSIGKATSTITVVATGTGSYTISGPLQPLTPGGTLYYANGNSAEAQMSALEQTSAGSSVAGINLQGPGFGTPLGPTFYCPLYVNLGSNGQTTFSIINGGYILFKNPSVGTGTFVDTGAATLVSYSGEISGSVFTFHVEYTVPLTTGEFTVSISGTTVYKPA